MTDPKLKCEKFKYYLKTNWVEYYYENIYTYMTDVLTFPKGKEVKTINGQEMIMFLSREVHVMVPSKKDALMRFTLSINVDYDDYIMKHLKHMQELYGGEIVKYN
jgi:hypothetical protein